MFEGAPPNLVFLFLRSGGRRLRDARIPDADFNAHGAAAEVDHRLVDVLLVEGERIFPGGDEFELRAGLRVLEGTIAHVPPQGGRKHPEQQYIQIDTTNILFICGGAFVGLEDIIARRVGKRNIGFGVKIDDIDTDKHKQRDWLLAQTTTDDLIHYGMIPEFVGRVPVITALKELDENALIQVLTKPKNALLKQYKKLFRYSNANIEFTESAIKEIAKKAIKSDTGARALRGVVEEVMLELQYNLDNGNGQTYVVTDEVVRGEKTLGPLEEVKAA